MKNKFTKRAEDALRYSKTLAEELGHTFIGTEHILIGLLSEKSSVASKLLISKGAEKDTLTELLCLKRGKGEKSKLSSEDMTPSAKKAILNAGKISERDGYDAIGTEHLLKSVLDESEEACKLLTESGISTEDLKQDVSLFFGAVDEMKERNTKREASHSQNKKTTVLNQYGKNLTESAKSGELDPIIGRDKELNRVITILTRKSKNNPLLIGDPGVGKTAIAEGLALAIANKSVPRSLYDKEIVCLDIASMIAGAKYRGEFEERLKNAINEAINDKNIILFIDEIHTIIGAGSAEGAMDAANILKPPLARGEILVIGATTYIEYTKHIEKDAALERRFQTVNVLEPTSEETLNILRGIKAGYERHHDVIIEDGALKEAINQSLRCFPDRYFPDKAIDVLDESAAYLRLKSSIEPLEITGLKVELSETRQKKEKEVLLGNIEKAQKLHKKEITKTKELINKMASWERSMRSNKIILDSSGVKEAVMAQHGVERGNSTSVIGFEPMSLTESIKSAVYGQDEACDIVAKAVLRGKLAERNTSKPIASLLFCGKNGVGKTHLAKELSKAVFGENTFIKLDMTEYTEKQSISKLIGSPPGYVGHEEPGKLTQAVRNHPESVIFFDKIEMACPEMRGIVRQIIEEGVLTDGGGRRAHFGNSIVIISTETPANGRRIGFGGSSADFSISPVFESELLNSVDETVSFKELDLQTKRKIATKTAIYFTSRLSSMGYEIEADDSLIEKIALASSSVSGRAIKRAICEFIEKPTVNAIFMGKLEKNEKYIIADNNGRTEIKAKQLV